MNKKKPSARHPYSGINPSIQTRDMTKLIDPVYTSGNVYESVVVLGQRARQISNKIKEELTEQLSQFNVPSDTLEEITENREQIEVSRVYERLAKPSAIAIEEFLEQRIYFRRPEVE